MRESPGRRLFFAAAVALAAGLLVAYDNPVRDFATELHQNFAAPLSLAQRAGAWLSHPARG